MSPSAEAYITHEHDDEPVRPSSPEDVDRLIDDLLAESWENSVAALYADGRLNAAGVPDHELLVAVDYETKSMGALRYMALRGPLPAADDKVARWHPPRRRHPRG